MTTVEACDALMTLIACGEKGKGSIIDLYSLATFLRMVSIQQFITHQLSAELSALCSVLSALNDMQALSSQQSSINSTTHTAVRSPLSPKMGDYSTALINHW